MKKLLLLGAAAFVTLAITGCTCPFMGDKCCKDGKCEMKDAKCCDKKDAKCDAPAAPAKCDAPATPAAPAK